MKICIFLLFLLVTIATVAPAQTTTVTDEATVYVYLGSVRSGFRRFTGMVFMDDKKTAEISEHRHFVLHPEPGKHTIYAKEKKFGGIEFDVEKGMTYYVKLEAIFEAGSTRFRSVSLVGKEEGVFAIKETSEPVRKTDVFDTKLVDMSIVSP